MMTMTMTMKSHLWTRMMMIMIGVLMMTPIMIMAENDDEDANDDKAEHPKSRRSRAGGGLQYSQSICKLPGTLPLNYTLFHCAVK